MPDYLMLLPKLQEDMRRALGHTLDTWGNVEAQLCSIFCAAFEPVQYEIASAAFSAILSFEVQIAIADAAIKERFKATKTVIADWKTVRKKLDGLRSARNKLAHGKMIIVRVKATKMHEPRFLPFFHYYTHRERKSFTHMDITDIKAIHKDFSGLVQTLSEFGKSINASQRMRQANWDV